MSASAFLQRALEFGLTLEQAIELMEAFERPVHAAPRRLYQRSPRQKAYGPFQDPDSYFSVEKLRAYNYAAKTQMLSVPVARLQDKDWLPLSGAVLRLDGYICTYCGADGEKYVLHCDHIIPIARGGQNVIDNLTTACEWCNCSKRDALPQEWRPIRATAQ